MNEQQMKAKIRAMIKPHAYIQSMSSLATAGTPDLWISGKKDVWCECKNDTDTVGAIKPKLSALQKQWCDNRYDDGRQVIVLVTTDSKTGILYTHGSWNTHSNDRRPLKDIILDIIGMTQ